MRTLIVPSKRKTLLRYFRAIQLVVIAGSLAMMASGQNPSPESIRALDRGGDYQNAVAAADHATEVVLSRLCQDLLQGGESKVLSQISSYGSISPTAGSDSYWTNFTYTMPSSGLPGVWAGRTTLSAPPFVTLTGTYTNLSGFASLYRVASAAQLKSTTAAAAVFQDIEVAAIPIFEYAVFYDGLMEFSDNSPFDVLGPVHGNGDIYFGAIISSHLTFDSLVSAGGIFTNPANAGFAQIQWQGQLANLGSPAPGVAIHQPILRLPLGTNVSAREIINPPPVAEPTNSILSSQRYFNKAFMVVTVTNPIAGTGTNPLTPANCSVSISIKNSMYDPVPINIYLGTNTGLGSAPNWTNTGIANWLTTNATFVDQREGRTNHTTQIDVGKLGSWIGTISGCTNALLLPKWNSTTPFNGIIYFVDNRTTNSTWMNCVRLINGASITNGLYSTGLTVATQNPLYLIGNFNCPDPALFGTTNVGKSRPSSIVCDAVTVLSLNWNDAGSFSSGNGIPVASNATVNCAIIAGNVPSTDATSIGFSGGVMNLPRLLEAWSQSTSTKTLTLNSSIVCLYQSAQATKQFQFPNVYYWPPARQFAFNQNFRLASGLPPGTPNLMVVQRLRRFVADPSADPLTAAP